MKYKKLLTYIIIGIVLIWLVLPELGSFIVPSWRYNYSVVKKVKCNLNPKTDYRKIKNPGSNDERYGGYDCRTPRMWKNDRPG